MIYLSEPVQRSILCLIQVLGLQGCYSQHWLAAHKSTTLVDNLQALSHQHSLTLASECLFSESAIQLKVLILMLLCMILLYLCRLPVKCYTETSFVTGVYSHFLHDNLCRNFTPPFCSPCHASELLRDYLITTLQLYNYNRSACWIIASYNLYVDWMTEADAEHGRH